MAPVTNSPPSISGVPDEEINVGKTYSFAPEASDPDGDALSFSVENAPAWAVFDAATGTLEGIPVAVNAGIKAIVGMMKGSEINDDEDFGITLMEDTSYFVYYIGTSFDMVIDDRDDPDSTSSLTIEPPLNAETIMILDPTDAFLYRFAGTPAGDKGAGESDKGLIPYFPELNFAELDSFNGHVIEKGAMGIGVKIFDFFEIGGTRVTKQPQFADIDWDDPLNSAVEYRAGMNGYADFALSIAGFGLLSFELAETSATFDVGLDRQHMALSLQVEPERPILPVVFGIQPLSTITGSGFASGTGEYGFELGGNWHSTLPEADIAGLLLVENGAVTLEGSVTEDGTALVASLEMFNDQTTGRVEFPESFAAGITGIVSGGLDRRLDEVEQAVGELEEAIADYEFEVSLRGLRDSLPAIADEATREANNVPDAARNHADETLTIYSRDTNDTLIDSSTAAQINTAAGNVHRIGETDAIVISSQDIVDRLPTEEVIESVRSEVKEGVASVPTVDGLGYTAIGDSYSAFATIDGSDREIPINVLKPSDVREGVGDLLAGLLLDATE